MGLLVTARDGANGLRKPFHVRCLEILDAWTFDKALLPVVQTHCCCSTNFLIGHAEGEVIDIEATPDYCSYLYPQSGLMTHANHLVRKTRIASQLERIAPHSLYHANRLERVLGGTAAISGWTPGFVWAMLGTSRFALLRGACRVVINTVSGIPILVQLF